MSAAIASPGRYWAAGPNGAPGAAMTACLTDAIAAPSIHNSQPWRFRIVSAGTVEVWADRARRLPVIDPANRELLISVGAALFNLRVAVLARGRTPLVMLFPQPDEADLIARLTVGPAHRPDATVAALAHAIPLRHTNRRPLRPIEVPDHVVGDLIAAARVEGGQLTVMDKRGRDAVLGLVRSANYWQRENPRYVTELAQWTGRRDEPDGIPATAFGPWDALETMPMRDFGQAYPKQPRRHATFETDPTIAVLYSGGDGDRQWVRTGQALERVLLTATVRGLATTPMSSVVEVPQLRSLLTDNEQVRTPQIVLRLGYGDPTGPSPRRPLADVVDPPPVAGEG
jgi:nitroreductase